MKRRVVMRPKNRTHALTGLALLCTAAVTATGAVAGETLESSVRVSYVAADLTRPESAEALYRRIRRAAKMVCDEPDIRELVKYQVYRQCFDRAVDDAVARVDATALTALHHSRMHNQPG
jgi:UrcA family protein